jgi:hypothetical protein
VFSAVLVVLAGTFFAAVLFFSTGGTTPPPKPGPIYIGLASDLHNLVTSGGPIYFAHPFGGTGFWLDLEHGHLVTLVARRPGTKSCTAKWESHRDAYIDCHGTKLDGEQLERYKLTVVTSGNEKGGVVVDFAVVLPAPEPLPAKT